MENDVDAKAGRSTPAESDPAPAEPALPERIGHYRILSLLGQGGMGSVFEAEQENPRRTVALKVVTTGVLSDQMRRRFELEAQVLGHLHHGCIAQIYEAGVFESPGGAQPYFAMELIHGVPLVRYAEEQRLGTRARLELMARVCDGVQHAHERGVIHRDLKPDNVLVDEAGQPKILDFGLARATDADIQAVTLHTDVGQIMGTIPYMSPEQAAGDPEQIDLRSDVYSLGVVAYELVSGKMPYAADDRRVLEALRVVREEEARPLSSVSRALRGDVDTIIGKALQKDPALRYPTAAALAADIRRHLANEPITARRPSTMYQLRKFTRRHKALVSGVGAVFLALVIGLVGTARGYVAAQADARRAQSTAEFFENILKSIDPAIAQGADTTLFKAILDDTAARIEAELDGRPLVAASIHSSMAAAYFSISEFEAALVQAEAAHARWTRELGENSPEAIAEHRMLASCLLYLDRMDAAYEEIQENLARAESVLGAEHRSTDHSRCLLGVAYLTDERNDDAARVFERVVAFRREHYPPDDGVLLNALNCLGLARLGQDLPDEAEPLLLEALAGRRRAYGDDHPDTLKALHNMGGLYRVQERFDESEEMYRDALARAPSILGPNHETTIQLQDSLAGLLRMQSRFDEALELQRAAYEANLALYGADDPRVLQSEHGLAVVYRTMESLPQAYEHAQHAHAGLTAWFGPEHPETLTAQGNLASVLAMQGDYPRAEELRLHMIEVRTRTLGPEDLDTLFVQNDLGVQYMRAGRAAESQQLLEDLLATRRRVQGDTHSDTLMTLLSLGVLFEREGRSDAAVPVLAEFLAGWPRLYGDDDPNVAPAAEFLQTHLARLDPLGPHEPAVRTLLAYHERTEPPGSTLVATDHLLLSRALLDGDRNDEARAALDTAFERFAGRDVPLAAHWTHGALLTAEGQYEDAEEALIFAWEEAMASVGDERRPIATRLAALYDAWDRPDEAAVWREEADASSG